VSDPVSLMADSSAHNLRLAPLSCSYDMPSPPWRRSIPGPVPQAAGDRPTTEMNGWPLGGTETVLSIVRGNDRPCQTNSSGIRFRGLPSERIPRLAARQ
jgi:hypothetical protein